MSDAQRERTQKEEAVRDSGSGEADYASAPSEASLAPEHVRGALGRDVRAQDESERVPVISGRSEEGAIIVQVVGRTDVGLVREHNEDNYLLADLTTGSRDPKTFREVTSAGLLLAVCDGMGGAAAGEVASQMAVDTLYEMMRRSVPTSDRDALARSLVNAIEEAGTRIFESARADRSRRGMGTTATVAALMDRTLFVGQVGDSRAYILRGGELKQITKDQSLVNQLIEAGQLTEDEAEAFEHSNIILQALGTTEQVSVDLTFLELRRGDRLLMCSDGLSGLVHGDVIRDVLVEHRDLGTCCERLIELAKAGGGHDNVTVILAEFSGEGLALPQPTDLVGYQQYPLPLDSERRAPPPVQSEVPTLAPPSVRPLDDDAQPPRDSRAAAPSSGSSGRVAFMVALLVGAAGALYYWVAIRDRRPRRVEAYQTVVPAPGDRAPSSVEVLVRTDVESSELRVDEESYGGATEGRWVLELPPGPHRLELRAQTGGSITSSLVTVREGVPATVVLSMPDGNDQVGDGGEAEESEATASEELDREGARAKPSRRSSADGGADHRVRSAKRAAEASGAVAQVREAGVETRRDAGVETKRETAQPQPQPQPAAKRDAGEDAKPAVTGDGKSALSKREATDDAKREPAKPLKRDQ